MNFIDFFCFQCIKVGANTWQNFWDFNYCPWTPTWPWSSWKLKFPNLIPSTVFNWLTSFFLQNSPNNNTIFFKEPFFDIWSWTWEISKNLKTEANYEPLWTWNLVNKTRYHKKALWKNFKSLKLNLATKIKLMRCSVLKK